MLWRITMEIDYYDKIKYNHELKKKKKKKKQ